MRFEVVPIFGKREKFTVIDNKTKKDLFCQLKGWENETIFSWCDALNKKYGEFKKTRTGESTSLPKG